MRKAFIFTMVALGACTPQEAKRVERLEKPAVVEAPKTALQEIQDFHDALEENCAASYALPTEGIEEFVLEPEDQDKADELLQNIGVMAQQCAGTYMPPNAPERAVGDSDCSFHCPVKWYWCIYNGGACAGGDNESCCKLGACGSKHHCEEVCSSSNGCHVPPMPSDGGGDGGDE